MRQVWYSEIAERYFETPKECKKAEDMVKNSVTYNALAAAEKAREHYVAKCNKMKSGVLREVEIELKVRKMELKYLKSLDVSEYKGISHGQKRRDIMMAGGRYMETWLKRWELLSRYRQYLKGVRHYQKEVAIIKARIKEKLKEIEVHGEGR